jgi:hypothetical protein
MAPDKPNDVPRPGETHAGPAEGRERFGPLWYGDQNDEGVDLSLIREMLKLTPVQRLRRMDRARRAALRLMEYGRKNLEKPT